MAEALLQRSGGQFLQTVAGELGIDEDQARHLLVVLTALHDIGKATPVFQVKWPRGAPPEAVVTRADDVPHGRASGIILINWLSERGVSRRLAASLANAVAIHHGHRLPKNFASHGTYDPRSLGEDQAPWSTWQRGLMEDVAATFGPLPDLITRRYLRGQSWALFAGLTSIADWLGSSLPLVGAVWNIPEYLQGRRELVERRLNEIGWAPRDKWWVEPKQAPTFADWFDAGGHEFKPRPLQVEVEGLIRDVSEPTLLIIEAPMGEGKTEAAFYSSVQPLGRAGAYIALPTQATSDAMHERLLGFVNTNRSREVNVALAHSASRQKTKTILPGDTEVHEEGIEAQAESESWFSSGRRELLAELGAGTIDQALLAVLPTRHFFVRLWGLAEKVVIFDEIHAYDSYTGGLLAELLNWLAATGTSVILMSATLPHGTRKRLLQAYGEGIGADAVSSQDTPYPRITQLSSQGARSRTFAATRVSQVEVQAAPYEIGELSQKLIEAAEAGGAVACIVNTVARAQNLYEACRARLSDVTLLHSRFPLNERKAREASMLKRFGPDGTRANRSGVVIATQVIEQSLDLDFDSLYSDLAPIDLLLQRTGRMHRHAGRERPAELQRPTLHVAGLAGEEAAGPDPDALDTVYASLLLWRTWAALQGKVAIGLPDDIDELVQLVYGGQAMGELEPFEAEVALAHLKHETRQGEEARAAKNWSLANPHLSATESWGPPGRDADDWREYALLVPTRLGEESISVIPVMRANDKLFVFGTDKFITNTRQRKASDTFISVALGKQIRAARKSLVAVVTKQERPSWWLRTGALKYHFPLVLDASGRAQVDPLVRLDSELGLLYESPRRER